MEADLKPVLGRIALGETLSEEEAETTFGLIMSGNASQAQIAALLMGMRVRGETIAELTGAVRAMRARMLGVTAPVGAIDVCGTGGDRHGTLNVSTAVAFVLAALGVKVAKHGNRGQSSRTGGMDVLAALGVPPVSDRGKLEHQLGQFGIAFLTAPDHHPAVRHAAGARAELGTRTLFNLLGPLCNPAGVKLQLVGLFDAQWLQPVASVLQRLGADRVWAVHGRVAGSEQGLDELTLAGSNAVVALEAGVLHSFELTPEMAGLEHAPVSAILGGDAQYNAAALEALLNGAPGAYRDTVVFNAAAALRVVHGGNIFPERAGSATEFAGLREAAELAAAAIDKGAARNVLHALRAGTSRH